MTGNVQRGPAARKLRDITIARPANWRREVEFICQASNQQVPADVKTRKDQAR